jgi:hypothetical protein
MDCGMNVAVANSAPACMSVALGRNGASQVSFDGSNSRCGSEVPSRCGFLAKVNSPVLARVIALQVNLGTWRPFTFPVALYGIIILSFMILFLSPMQSPIAGM